MMGEQFAVPERLRMAQATRFDPQVPFDGFPRLVVQPPRASRPLGFAERVHTPLLETPHPPLHRGRVLAKPFGNLVAAVAMGYQQHPVQTMVVAGFFRPIDLVL